MNLVSSDVHESSCTDKPTAAAGRSAQSGGTEWTSATSGSHPPPLQSGSQSAAAQSPPQSAAASKNQSQVGFFWLFEDANFLSASLQQGGVSHMQGMMPHQGLGQQMVHPTPGGGAQMQGQWRQPLGGQETPPL